MFPRGCAWVKTNLLGAGFLFVVCVTVFAQSVSRADQDCPVYWAMWGSIPTSTMTAVMGISTGTLPSVMLKSESTPDCFILGVNSNGTLKTTWVQCPN